MGFHGFFICFALILNFQSKGWLAAVNSNREFIIVTHSNYSVIEAFTSPQSYQDPSGAERLTPMLTPHPREGRSTQTLSKSEEWWSTWANGKMTKAFSCLIINSKAFHVVHHGWDFFLFFFFTSVDLWRFLLIQVILDLGSWVRCQWTVLGAGMCFSLLRLSPRAFYPTLTDHGGFISLLKYIDYVRPNLSS